MIISQIADKEVDQNEIESKYIWYPCLRTINRINLTTLAVDFSSPLPNSIHITHCMPISNNQLYGIGFENFGTHLQYQFIADENMNMKIIEKSAKNAFNRRYFTCFYDDSIFSFECFFDLLIASRPTCSAKRYLISQNKWITLADLPFKCSISVIGLNQKLIIAADNSSLSGIWIYDINLDTYNHFSVKNIDKKACKMILKIEQKIYLVIYKKCYEIYVSDNLWSEWTFISEYEENKFSWQSSPHILYDKAIYYFRYFSIFKFELASFESIEVGILKSSNTDETS